MSTMFSDYATGNETIGTDYSFSRLSRLAAPLSETVDYGDGTPYEVFIE